MEAHQFTGVWGKWQDRYNPEDSQSRGTFLTANVAQTKAKLLERAIQRKEKRTTMDEKRIWINALERSNSFCMADITEIKTYKAPPQDGCCGPTKLDIGQIATYSAPPRDVHDHAMMIARLCGVSPETKYEWDELPAELAVVVRKRETQSELPTYNACKKWMRQIQKSTTLDNFRGLTKVDDACIEDVCSMWEKYALPRDHSSDQVQRLVNWLHPAVEVCQTLGTKRVREIIAEQELLHQQGREDEMWSPFPKDKSSVAAAVDMDESELTDHGWMDHKQDHGARPGYITATMDQDGAQIHFLQRGSLLDHLISHGGCDIDRTEERGATIWQLRAHYNEIENRCERDGWRSSWNNEPLVAESVNLYDTMALLVKPVTEQRLCSFVELVATAAQPPRWFCSHWWGESCRQFLLCLSQHNTDFGLRSDCEAIAHGLDQDSPYWVCAFANNQWNLEAELTKDPSHTSFYKAIQMSEGTISILDQSGTVFTRIWCGYETYESLSNNPSSQYKWACYTAGTGLRQPTSSGEISVSAAGLMLGRAPRDGNVHQNKCDREAAFPLNLANQALTIELQNAEASFEDDRVRILNKITSSDLDAIPVKEHEKYDSLNHSLRANFAISSLAGAVDQGTEQAFLDSISKGSMKHIQLDCSHFPLKVVERLATSLPASLKRLQLTLGEDGDSQFSCFARLISGVSLDHLDVSSSNLCEAAAHALADALSSRRLQVTEELNLKDNPLGTDGVLAIAQCIGDECATSLTSFCFAGVTPSAIQTSHDQTAILVENYTQFEIMPPDANFKPGSTIRIHGLQARPEMNDTLALCLKFEFALWSVQPLKSEFAESFWVRPQNMLLFEQENRVDPPHAELRALTQDENCNLNSFFDAISTAALTNLATLDISNNNLGEDGTSAFCNSVNDGQLRQLSTLIISRNEISDAGTIHLAQSISAMVLPSLTAIDVSSNSVGEGLISLVGALTDKLPGFKELDISLNEIEDATAEVLLDALTSNQLPSIQVLGLELNGLSPQMELRCSGIIHCSPADIEAEATNNCQCLPVDPHLTRAMLTRAHEKLPLPRKPNAFVTDGLRQPVLSVDPSDLHLVVQPSHFDTEMDYGQWTKPTDYDKVIDEDEVLDEQLRVYAAREKRFGSSTMRMSHEKCRSRRRELAIATQERQDKKNVDKRGQGARFPVDGSLTETDFAKLRSEGGVDVVWLIKKDSCPDYPWEAQYVQHNHADGTYEVYCEVYDFGHTPRIVEIVDQGHWTMEGGIYKGKSAGLYEGNPTDDIKGVLHGDSGEMYMDVEFGYGYHKYVYTSDRWIAGCQESKLSRWIRTSPSCVVAQPLRQNCFVTLLLGELTQD